ncbi:B12-binding domain-containing radical SAM protein [Dehalobacterium formicoaceticum]|uniref:B12-binding domain-containing radical SAM protein n=1 Tax=Dehalobacterium formicoaceticum TaxID=51515 RepID=A0ABT1XZX3_9FIRM|nr:radical SAM protein [Dehalobacterium formicoaceticum]MCR6544167.1 B12-binding domain-containing radical SAM protein [Dehalobacterium formicoaceticum]
MKILLINPPIPYKYRMFDYADEEGKKAISRRILVGPPLGLNDIAGMLREEDVIIIDQKTEMDQYPDYDPLEAAEEEIYAFQPDIVGITCLTAQYNYVRELLAVIRKINKNILTVVGGVYPTLCPQEFAGTGADILAIGIGKLSFSQIVQEYKEKGRDGDYSHIYGLALSKGNGFVFTKSLGEMSYQEFQEQCMLDDFLPNRDLTERYEYIFPFLNKKIQYLSTSHGCTHRCNFCTLWQLTDGRYFFRKVESMIRELKGMDQYPIIRFCDANTFGNVKEAQYLFERIIEEGLHRNHMYFADLRTDTVLKHPELIQLAAKAGLKVAVCGVEATDDEELERYEKKNNVETIKEAYKIMNEAGMFVNGNYIIRPDYTEKDFERVGRFIEDNPIFHAGLTILTPFPGTQQWEELKSQVVIHDLDYYNLTNAVLKTALPEKEFYHRLTELFKTSGRATGKFFSLYGKEEYKKFGLQVAGM